jgi:hypothetical protein
VATIRVAQILSSVLEGSTRVTDVPHRLVMACTQALPVTGVGLALMSDAGHAGTVAVSDAPAATMEELQFTLGEGPCVDCSVTGRPVLQPDLAGTGPGRWPGFSAGALECGIRAIFALPLRVGAIRLGVLDLYRDQAGELTAEQLTEALAFADAATALLLHLHDQPSLDGSALGAITVIEDRAEVHQATGMISVLAGVDMAEALVRLRARAYATERPILDVARDVLAGNLTFDDAYDKDDEK